MSSIVMLQEFPLLSNIFIMEIRGKQQSVLWKLQHILPYCQCPRHWLLPSGISLGSVRNPAILVQKMLQKTPEDFAFEAVRSSHSKIAAPVIGGCLAWDLPMFWNCPSGSHFVISPASHGSHFVVLPSSRSQNFKSAHSFNELKELLDPGMVSAFILFVF